jgi:hypothetical protein
MFLAQTSTVIQKGQCIEFTNVLTREQVLSKARFFQSDKAIVCCEISYGSVEQSNSDALFRQNLWDSYANGLQDLVTIKVDGKEFKVMPSNNFI